MTSQSFMAKMLQNNVKGENWTRKKSRGKTWGKAGKTLTGPKWFQNHVWQRSSKTMPKERIANRETYRGKPLGKAGKKPDGTKVQCKSGKSLKKSYV